MPSRITIAVPWFDRNHYQVIRDTLGRGAALPPTFDLWEFEAQQLVESLLSRDIAAQPVLVTPDDLRFFCELSGAVPTFGACEAIATLELAKGFAGLSEEHAGIH